MFRQSGSTFFETDIEELKRLSKQAAQNDPQVLALKNENQRLALQALWDYAFPQIFSTPVDFPDGKKVAFDNEANRLEIPKWVNPGEHINNPREWFVRVLKESPSLAGRISWTEFLTSQQEKAQAEKDAQGRREKALATCRQYGLSECEANLHILTNHDGVVVWVANGPTLMTDVVDEGELPLVAASQAELQKYTAEKEAARVGHLQNLAQTNNVAELRRIAKQDAMGQQESFESTRQQILNRDLAYQYERDQMAGYVTPLPAQITPEQIRKWDTNQMRQQMKRYGASRISARLHQITEIPNPNGHGTYKFEE